MTNAAIAKVDPHEELEKLDSFYAASRAKLAEQVAQADRIAAEQKLAADDADRGKRMVEATEVARMLIAESVAIDRLLVDVATRLAERRTLSRELVRIVPEQASWGHAFEHTVSVSAAITASGVGHFMRLPARGGLKLAQHDTSRLSSFDLKSGKK